MEAMICDESSRADDESTVAGWLSLLPDLMEVAAVEPLRGKSPSR